MRALDGREFPVELSFGAVRDASGQPIAFVGVTKDITARKQAAEALEKSEARYRGLVERAGAGVATTDLEGKFTLVNQALCDMIGYSEQELIARPFADFLHPDDIGRVLEIFLSASQNPGREVLLEFRVIHKDGRIIYCHSNPTSLWYQGEIIGFSAIIQDITARVRAEEERERLQAQMQHVQKLESLSVLAGGVAHDFNNLLVAILGNADLALMELPSYSSTRPSLEEIKKAAQRAAGLSAQMLAYSGRGRFVVGPVNLSELVRGMEELLRATSSLKALLKYELAADLPLITADVTQIRQVVMNLVTNASESLGEASGTITIATKVVEADQTYLSQTYLGEALPEGRYVSLEVSDTGSGMDEATLARIFEPFFSTKFTGRGLGLPATLGIVRGHKGAVKVESTLGKGTTFTVLFPVGEQPPSSQQPPLKLSEESPWRGSGTILVVDEEEAVCKVAKAMLERYGFTVRTAANGPQAIQVAGENPAELVAVLLDAKAPDMEIAQTFYELQRLHPGLPIILTSGYSREEINGRLVGLGLAGVIQKPFQLEVLIETVRKAVRK